MQKKIFAAILLTAFPHIYSFAEGSLIADVEDKWKSVSYCKVQVFVDPEIQYAIYQNDRNRLAETESFLKKFSKEKFGEKDAQALDTAAFFAGSFMQWGKEKKLVKGLPLEEKLAVLKWCRSVFLKE